MSKATKTPLTKALPVAEEIVYKLSPYCKRIEIAGSIRRKRPMIGAIEIVALPKTRDYTNLLGEVYARDNLLHRYLIDNNVNLLKGVKEDAKQKQFLYSGYKVDLFLPASPAHWGSVFATRTGSNSFNRWVMSIRRFQVGIKFREGLVYRGLDLLDTSEERGVFDALGMAFVPPEMRDGEKWLVYQGVALP